MYCANCGQELNNDARFCSKCGSKVQEGAQTERQDDKQEQSSIHCPVCNRTDKTEKISVIVSKDTHKLSGISQEWVSDKDGGFWRTVPISGKQMSELARNLTPPPQPQAISYSWLDYSGRIIALVMGFILLIVGLSDLDAFIVYVPCILICAISGILGIMAKTKHDNKEQARIDEEEPLWKSAMEVWNRLYFCYRDDIVFDPDTKSSCQPQDVRNFCYRPISQAT